MTYASITCLMSTIHQSIQVTGCNLQPFYEKLESLRANLEKSSWKTATEDQLKELTTLEVEITGLACCAEDMVDVESQKVFVEKDKIMHRRDSWELPFLLKQAVENIDSAINKWMTVQNIYMTKTIDIEEAQNLTITSTSFQHVVELENIMVGNENEFEMMQELIARGTKELDVVSIVGMRGVGKTTLANKIYSDAFIMSRFDIRAKVTVSQDYCRKNILLGLLFSLTGETHAFYGQRDDGQLAEQLQKQAWDDIKLCFPDCKCGSRLLMTTRNMDVAEYASLGNPPHQICLLNSEESWNLLHRKVFEGKCFSLEFEEIGKQIALECGGLPLAIIVIAGLLSKMGKTLGEWKVTDVDVQCMRVMALSYHHLPHHLKPCFLYFAIFPEDEVIFVEKLMEFWVVEGFLKAEETKSIEEVAEKYIKDLIDRSLILIHNLSFDEKIESCRMHDVTRELCLRESQNVNFVNVIRRDYYQNPCSQSMCFPSKSRGRISIQLINMPDHVFEDELARYPSNPVSSIICFRMLWSMPKFLCFKLLRVLDLAMVWCDSFPSGIIDLIHLRYLALTLSPGLPHLCYLQTLILKFVQYWQEEQGYPLILPSEILMMPQLRHLFLDWNYLQFHEPKERSLVLKILQCLSGWNPLYCTKSVFRLLPNLRKLQIHGIMEDYRNCMDHYEFCYLDQLEELEFHQYYNFLPVRPFFLGSRYSDYLRFTGRNNHFCDFLLQIHMNLWSFPYFLRWKDLSIVGKLPKLEALKLQYHACIGEKWEVVEEGFPCLKFLHLEDLDLYYWRATCDHFPCLERLFLKGCRHLDSIPQDFADITTLALIDISKCSKSVGNSAKQIQQDIQDN
ncbi:unnamed protein product [Withania somnifera]